MKKYADFLHNISGKILLGCDGFVDETYEIVEVRKSQSEFTPMKKLKQFGELLVERADGGVGVELVPKRRCEGGFGINTGRVAACLGLKPCLPGLYGSQTIDPAYHEFEEICDLVSLGDPALTIALEFSDGKVLMSNLEAVSSLTWEDFKKHFGEEKLKELFSGVDILGWAIGRSPQTLTGSSRASWNSMKPALRRAGCSSTSPTSRKSPANHLSKAWS